MRQPVPGMRRKARRLAFQALFEIDCTGHDTETVFNSILAGQGLSEENSAFAHELVTGVINNKKKIDDLIRKLAPVWPLEQISAIDRNILRLAIFEILINNKVPVKVAINEAVELAKTYGGDSSPRFVNGVLASVINYTEEKSNEKGGKSGNHFR